MVFRYLLGPVPPGFLTQRFPHPCPPEGCQTFTLEQARLASGWEGLAGSGPPPDALLLHLPYNSLTGRLFDAPLPVIAVASDAPLQWHAFRHALARCDAALADAPSVAMGVATVRRSRGCVERFGLSLGPPLVRVSPHWGPVRRGRSSWLSSNEPTNAGSRVSASFPRDKQGPGGLELKQYSFARGQPC
jgi:hypothetical protein